ncbi:MAG: presqualene diphosphate synthase HpnD [Luteitalea sp.]|nr:presqualene diphosphate synthase HpnD [Luteitalea sp.]
MAPLRGDVLALTPMGRDTNFYYSFLVLSPDRRRAVVAVWDFCRAVDDAVDEPGERDGAEALAFWRAELDRCFSTRAPDTAQGRALVPWITRFNLPRQPFEDLIDGVAMDLIPRRYASFDELREYCLRVAAAVGLICLEIFGYENPAARQYAVELGLALQLTNILRDVGSDLRRGRLYIPLEDLSGYNVEESDLRAGRLTPRVVALLAHQAARCREFFARARAALPREDARRLAAAEIMGAIYVAILERIEQRNFDVFSERVRLPRPVRALIAFRTWVQIMVGVRGQGSGARRDQG